MQFVKNGKLYDTKTAIWCGGYGEYINNRGYDTDENFRQSLFKKNNGEFFLLEEKYKEVNGSEWMYTTPTVTPLTEKEARKWGEEHLSVPLYEAAFGKVEE